MCIYYGKPPKRRPVWTSFWLGLTDLQGVIPRAWCQGCGGEVFARDALQCPRCEKEEKYHVHKERS